MFLEIPLRITEHRWPEDTQPLVSISCITYNHEHFIRDAIEGFLMQETTFPVEILIHDDASTDNTATIVKEYENRHPSLISPIYQTENQYSKGLNPGYNNRGRAKGKYIALCEGDDYWTDPLKLQKQVEFLEANEEYVASGHNTQTIFENDPTRLFFKWPSMIDTPPTTLTLEDHLIIYPKYGHRIPYHTSSYLFCNKKIDPSVIMHNAFSGDYLLFILMAQYGQVKIHDELMSVHRKHSKGITSLNTSEYVSNNRIEMYKRLNAYLDYEYDLQFKNLIKYYSNSAYIANQHNLLKLIFKNINLLKNLYAKLRRRISGSILAVLPFVSRLKIKQKELELIVSKNYKQIIALELFSNNILKSLCEHNESFCYHFDKEQLQLAWFIKNGSELDLENPKTFGEKIQWLKLNLRKPIMCAMTDKAQARYIVKEKIGEQYLNQLFGVYENVEDLVKDFARFPEKFVIKTNHLASSKGIIFVSDKLKVMDNEINEFRLTLKQNYYYSIDKLEFEGKNHYIKKAEWNYRNISPRIIVEEMLIDNEDELKDYKVWCFNGEPKFIQLHANRFSNHKKCFYSTQWEKLPFNLAFPFFEGEIERPQKLEEMLEISRKLASGFPFISIDLYIVNNTRIVFGEFTFYPSGGFGGFEPTEWDIKLGEMIDLTNVSRNTH